MTKHCRKCDTTKPVEEFFKDRHNTTGYKGSCKVCSTKASVRWHKANRDALRQYDRKRRPPMSAEERAAFYTVNSYGSAHARVARVRGKASTHLCIDCGSGAQEWSYRGGANDEVVEVMASGLLEGRSVAYSADPADYDPRCVSCHRKFDANKQSVAV